MDAWDPDPANSRFITKVNRRKTYAIVGAVVGIILVIAAITVGIILGTKNNDDSNKVDVTPVPNTTVVTQIPPLTKPEKIIIVFNIGYQKGNNNFTQVNTSITAIIEKLQWQNGNITIKLIPYSDVTDLEYAVDNLNTSDALQIQQKANIVFCHHH
jgi:hypothetical protein